MNNRILNKIKKLMAMVERGNPNESANAMKKVQALMAGHNISSEDVALMGIEQAKVNAANNSAKQPTWSNMLVVVVSTAFGVESLFSNSSIFGRSAAKVIFIGPAERVEIAGYVYTVLGRQLKSARSQFISTLNKRIKASTKTARADLFCEGWCNGVYSKITAMVPTEQENNQVSEYMAKHYPEAEEGKSRDAKSTRRGDSARVMGFIASKSVELNAGVSGQEQAKLGVA